jgi:ElaB/YqjD/DUF883 family membrane-anchored ribosome-binding protein
MRFIPLSLKVEWPEVGHCWIDQVRNMKKTVEQCLEELPDGYRERALKNRQLAIKHGVRAWEIMTDAMYSAIQNAFDASEDYIEEGPAFWDQVALHYFDGRYPLPELP